MSAKPVRVLLYGAISCLVFTISCGESELSWDQTRGDESVSRLNGETVWNIAIEHPMPVYPQRDGKPTAEGLVVVEVEIDGSGSIVRSEVLESSNTVLAHTTTKSLRGWRFTSSLDTTRIGRLVFYFRVVDDSLGVFVANDPKQRDYLIQNRR